MLTNYIFPKFEYTKKGISCIFLSFDNGDSLEVSSDDILDFSLNVYDRLVRSYNGFNPVVESGCLRFKINYPVFENMHNKEDYVNNKKAYVERFTCNKAVNMLHIYDSSNWRKALHCVATVEQDGESFVLKFLSQPQMGSASSKNHFINAPAFDIENISDITLSFENCESVVVYFSEIEKIDFEFDEKLDCSSGELNRKLIGGYLQIRLEEPNRRGDFLDEPQIITLNRTEKRLCGKKGTAKHDVCDLYIESYTNIDNDTECIKIDELKSDEEVDRLEKMEEDDFIQHYYYEGGCCKKLSNGSIIIAFGKKAKETIAKLC